MRLVYIVLMFAFLSGVQVASAQDGTPPGGRQAVLQTGRGSWTVDTGGPMSPIEVAMQRTASGWQVRVHGMYPIMGADGKISGAANHVLFWIADEVAGGMTYLTAYSQTQTGHWEPGDFFEGTFMLQGHLFEDHPHLGMHLCVGSDQSCWPSPNLEPNP